jgi:dethiobiotin synthetase
MAEIKDMSDFPKIAIQESATKNLSDPSTTDDRCAGTKDDRYAGTHHPLVPSSFRPSSSRAFSCHSERSEESRSMFSEEPRPCADIDKVPKTIFITGTDTGVGKTLVSAILLAGLNGYYWKPIQSGLEEMTDREWISENTGLPKTHFFDETYKLTQPLSPHSAARHDGIRIDLDSFIMPDVPESEHLIIEGAGGVMVPLNERHLMIDVMKRLAAPVLLVCRSSLGTINHTLLSLEQLRREELDVLGVIMNGPRNPENREAIEHYGRIKVLAEVEPLPFIDPLTLKTIFFEYFNSLMRIK